MKNCIPLFIIILYVPYLYNCTNLSNEIESDLQTIVKDQNINENYKQDTVRCTGPNCNPDPPKDGDDWLMKI